MVIPAPPTRPGTRASAVAGSLLTTAVVSIGALWAVVFGPLWLFGEQRQLLLWFWAVPLAFVPWLAAIAALVLALVGWSRGRGRKRAALAVCCAVVVLLAPIVMVFGPGSALVDTSV
ncbi:MULTISPECIES: hypothetical protein [unclassified Curtobacterium]|uniref:hypothetical protein n=1 Tax=unclassified Curtobacterium TaxID=257496 RepID=UPI001045F31F|nr:MULTISPECIES: hypothetical protein [unclassified Curtobacterium]